MASGYAMEIDLGGQVVPTHVLSQLSQLLEPGAAAGQLIVRRGLFDCTAQPVGCRRPVNLVNCCIQVYGQLGLRCKAGASVEAQGCLFQGPLPTISTSLQLIRPLPLQH